MFKAKFRSILIITVLMVCLLLTGIASAFFDFGVKWDEAYSFDKSNTFKREVYQNGQLKLKPLNMKTHYKSGGDNFVIKMEKGDFSEITLIDKKNQIAIQIFGENRGVIPKYNASGFTYPSASELKRLDIVPTSETKQIAGYNCKKYTYTYKAIFGEVWITDQISLSNDLGVFRALRMAAKHNTLSVPGFVMEMTTEDSGGGRTLMTTVSINNDENYVLNFKGVDMTTAINKVNYYTF